MTRHSLSWEGDKETELTRGMCFFGNVLPWFRRLATLPYIALATSGVIFLDRRCCARLKRLFHQGQSTGNNLSQPSQI